MAKKPGSDVINPSRQMQLFEILDSRDSEFSNTVELYDALPKYYWGEQRELDPASIRNPVITRHFKSRGAEYSVKISPAIIEREDKDGVLHSVLIYPGPREEIVEEVLRRYAVSGSGREINDEAGVVFTISQLRRELARQKHTFRYDEIKESLLVMQKAHLECRRLSGDTTESFSGTFLGRTYLTTRKDYLNSDENTKGFTTFHPLVTHSIRSLTFRLYSYQISMQIRSSLARYIYKRMSHYWTQASEHNPYEFKVVSYLEASPRGLSVRMKDNLRAIRNALDELKKRDVLQDYYLEPIKSKEDRRVTKDAEVRCYPHPTFIARMKRANHHQKQLRQQPDPAG